MHPVLVFMEIGGKGQARSFQGLALDREIKFRIRRINNDIDILGIEGGLLQAVGKAGFLLRVKYLLKHCTISRSKSLFIS
jgi:hypothetical protein